MHARWRWPLRRPSPPDVATSALAAKYQFTLMFFEALEIAKN